jgi:hypothetical protein
MAEWPGCYQVGVRVSDSKGAFSTAVACVGVSNIPPTITTLTATNAATGLQEPIRLVSGSATSTIDVAFRDPGERDRIVADIDCGNGTRSGGFGIRSPYRNTCTYAATGVYTVAVRLDDSDRGSDFGVYQYVVVYDPSAGFVTGGGWINSPTGACSATYCTYTGEGKASFGFVSKYGAGRNQPDGNTEFQFRAGGLNFKSTSYETLVVSGNRAQYWGSGTVNGAAGFTFRLTAVDGQVLGNDGTVDKFRIEIWAGNTVGAGQIVYDNQSNAPQTAQLTTALGGGSITIKK